jgi:pimeloyl-ACP methyl ester carboxylesterase
LDQAVEAESWPDSRNVQEVRFHSSLLSAFYQRDITDSCAVVLPPSYYNQPQRRYPVVYTIPGFGGDHRRALQYAETAPKYAPGDQEFIRVFLSGQTKWGHHEYADSATNGPRGQSLVRELIPEIDRRFLTIPNRNARFLYGHSSGGWSALWLMINYPETFGGVWSTSPDPVDFRDFQGINLYADPPQNMYLDESGQRRPLARRNDQVWIWFDTFGHMDDVIKRGGQLRSFEAVFSPLDANGQPQQLWDRQTGQINPQVAREWQKYDLQLLIQQNWPRLKPLLEGRVHIVTGDKDTFYLDGAVRLLDQSLKQLGSDAEVILLPGRGHIDYLTPEFHTGVRGQMTDLFRRLNASGATESSPAPVGTPAASHSP